MSGEISRERGRVLLLGAGAAAREEGLRGAGFEVRAAADPGESGGEGRPEVVVLEVRAGDGTALETLRRLRLDPFQRLVPVVLLVPELAPSIGALAELPLVERLPADVPAALLAERVRGALETRRLLELSEKKSERLASLFEVWRALNSTLDSGAILYMIARQLSEAMELVRCSFIVPDLSEGIGRVIACKDDPNIHALEINLANYPEIIQVLRSGQRVIIADVDRDPIMAGIRKFADIFRDQSIMTLPLVFHDETIGVLQIRKKSQRKGFTPREIEYCELLAGAAANALKNAQLYEDIEKHNYELRRQKRELEQLSEELRQKNQELIELQQLKEDFTAMIVHDLKSPLMIVQGVLDLLLHRHRGQAEDRDLIHDGIAVTKRILSLIGNLLEVSRMESGEVELQREELEVAELVREAVEPYQVVAQARGIRLEAAVEEDLPALWADRRGIGQVLDNLIGNAFKFTRDGGHVVVRAAREAGTAPSVRLAVVDDGAGIAAEDLPEIFKKFRQGRHERRKGTGLGLTIVSLVVAAHGGTVSVESERGKGSCFTVSLPAAPAGARLGAALPSGPRAS